VIAFLSPLIKKRVSTLSIIKKGVCLFVFDHHQASFAAFKHPLLYFNMGICSSSNKSAAYQPSEFDNRVTLALKKFSASKDSLPKSEKGNTTPTKNNILIYQF
jgi:hypothetical protein